MKSLKNAIFRNLLSKKTVFWLALLSSSILPNLATGAAEAEPVLEQSPVLAVEEPRPILGERPPAVQAAVDQAFRKNKSKLADGWMYDGSGFYDLLGIDEEVMLKNLASRSTEKDDIYIIDVGCGMGGWGKSALEFLASQECIRKTGKRFHVISVTGGEECQNVVDENGNIMHYQFNQFKIENIDEELLARGFDLKNKVDLIVSRWTLRHLVDPFGTLKRLYGLLDPSNGMLLSNGFLFALEDQDDIEGAPRDRYDILNETNAVPLFRYYEDGPDAHEFLVQRRDARELDIPLEYTGEVRHVGPGWQCASQCVTVFKKSADRGLKTQEPFCFKRIKKDTEVQEYTLEQEGGKCDFSGLQHYCDSHNQLSKDLYADLVRKELFKRPRW